jgi:transcriptional regulator with XRE-family HTH domain
MTAEKPRRAAGRPAQAAQPALLAEALRAARERAGLSLRELAVRVGVSPSTLIEAEAGRDVRHSTVQRCMAVLPGLSPHRLLGHGVPPMPVPSPACWEYFADVLGFTIRRMRFEVRVAADGTRLTHLEATGIQPQSGDLRDAATRTALVQLVLRGSDAARAGLDATASDIGGRMLTTTDGCFRHEVTFPRSFARSGFTYVRRQVPGEAPPAAFGHPGSLALSAPFGEGISTPVEHAIESLELLVRLPSGRVPPEAHCCAWTDVQALAADEPDFVPFIHPEGVRVEPLPRVHALRCTVTRPLFGFTYGVGWGEPRQARPRAGPPAPRPIPPRAGRTLGQALAEARKAAGASQRELAARAGVSPVTIAGIERGQDARLSLLRRLMDELPALTPEAVLAQPPAPGPIARREAWELFRLLLGLEADEERKTLHVAESGDAHAVCETIRLRRVRPAEGDLRVRYSSVQALGKRLPTVLKEIEERVAAEAEDAGLKARVVARHEGRLIHEITVPRQLAQVGVSFTRRLFDAGFFDAKGEQGPTRHDGAAIVPFQAVRRLHLEVTLPPGRWPERVWFAAHPRMMLEGPLPEADVAARLHPEGLTTRIDRRARTLTLSVEYPLIGFMYDIFWERVG